TDSCFCGDKMEHILKIEHRTADAGSQPIWHEHEVDAQMIRESRDLPQQMREPPPRAHRDRHDAGGDHCRIKTWGDRGVHLPDPFVAPPAGRKTLEDAYPGGGAYRARIE